MCYTISICIIYVLYIIIYDSSDWLIQIQCNQDCTEMSTCTDSQQSHAVYCATLSLDVNETNQLWYRSTNNTTITYLHYISLCTSTNQLNTVKLHHFLPLKQLPQVYDLCHLLYLQFSGDTNSVKWRKDFTQ